MLGLLGLQGGDTLQTTLISIIEVYLLMMIAYADPHLVPARSAVPMARLRYGSGRSGRAGRRPDQAVAPADFASRSTWPSWWFSSGCRSSSSRSSSGSPEHKSQ